MIVRVVPGVVTRELRRQVLRPSWPVGSAMHGDDDPAAVHIAAQDEDGTTIGACLLLDRPYPGRPERAGAWQLRGMATADGRRGQGVGAAVLAGALAELRARGATLLWCEARVSAVDFYAQHGFTADSDVYPHSETGIAHRLMYREPSVGAASSDTGDDKDDAETES
ncbi:MAG TPA: GNAT family N-acetyltransferase [Jatrophihabitantaceae bacterium]